MCAERAKHSRRRPQSSTSALGFPFRRRAVERFHCGPYRGRGAEADDEMEGAVQLSKDGSNAAVSGSPQGRTEAGGEVQSLASPYGLDRLFLENSNSIPFNTVLSFNSVTEVENYFGVDSAEARLATEFFSGYNGPWANMLFDRMPLGGGRARIYGANLSGLTVHQLQKINGTLSLTSEGYNFDASINLASATSFASAAGLIQSELNAAQPTVATTTGSSIAPGSASFTGSIEGGLMVVTAVSSGKIAVGGTLTSANGFRADYIPRERHAWGRWGLRRLVWSVEEPHHCSARNGTLRILRDFDDRRCQFRHSRRRPGGYRQRRCRQYRNRSKSQRQRRRQPVGRRSDADRRVRDPDDEGCAALGNLSPRYWRDRKIPTNFGLR